MTKKKFEIEENYGHLVYNIWTNGIVHILVNGINICNFWWRNQEMYIPEEHKHWKCASGKTLNKITQVCKDLEKEGFFKGKMTEFHPEEIRPKQRKAWWWPF